MIGKFATKIVFLQHLKLLPLLKTLILQLHLAGIIINATQWIIILAFQFLLNRLETFTYPDWHFPHWPVLFWFLIGRTTFAKNVSHLEILYYLKRTEVSPVAYILMVSGTTQQMKGIPL